MVKTRRSLRAYGIGLAALSMLAAACGTEGGASAGSSTEPTVMATTSIWADVVANVACDGSVNVETLIPIGADAHAFEPSLADRARLDSAALVVANGLLLEQGLGDTLDASAATGTTVLRLGELVDTIAFGPGGHGHTHVGVDDHADDDDHEGEDHHDDAGHGEVPEGIDPHIWFDPSLVVHVLPAIVDALVADAGLDREVVQGCADEYRAELEALDADIAARVEALPAARRMLVSNHQTLGYFAHRYGFEVVGTVSPAPSGLAQADPAGLIELVERMEAAGVEVVFADAAKSIDEAEAVAGRVDGGRVVTLFTETLTEPDGEAPTYIDLLRIDADRIVDALG